MPNILSEQSPEAIAPDTVPMLNTEEGNKMQIYLIERSARDPADWIARNADRFRDLVNKNAELRVLVRRDKDAAAQEIERLLQN